VSQQAEQRHRRGIDRTVGELGGIEAFALELQGQALAAQELDEGRPLVAQRCAGLARVSVELREHVGAVLWLRHGAMLAARPPRRQPTSPVVDASRRWEGVARTCGVATTS